MALTQVQLDEFKTSFTKQLENFMQKRETDMGDPAQRRPYYARARHILHFTGPQNEVTFTVKNVPGHLTAEDEKTLRQTMYDICEKQGFRKTYANNVRLPETLQTKDDWRRFVTHTGPQYEGYAATCLNADGPNPSIIEPEDVVNDAYGRLLGLLRRGETFDNRNIGSTAKRHVLWSAGVAKRNIHTQKFDALPPEPESPTSNAERRQQELLKEQLPDIIEIAKTRMTDTQRQIIDIISENHAANNKALSLADIARERSVSKATVWEAMEKVTRIIQQTAKEMGPGYEEAAATINRIVLANGKGPVQR